MDRIRHFADISIRRACGFGFLAIATAMVGMASNVHLAVRLGAIGASLMVAILLLKAYNAPARSFRRTEVWLLLDRRLDLPENHAQRLFGEIMKERYLWHARWSGLAAGSLWLIAIVLAFAAPPAS